MAKIKVPAMVGQKISEIRAATPQELEDFGWEENPHEPCTVIVLENGIKIVPSSDGEGNSFGVLFGHYKGNQFYVHDFAAD